MRFTVYLFVYLLLALPFAYAQDLSQDIISEETQLLLSLPEGWTSTYSPGGQAFLILEGDGIELYVSTPATLIFDGLDNIDDVNQLLSTWMTVFEWEEIQTIDETVNGRDMAVATYQVDNFEGIIVGVPLANGTFAVVETVTWNSVEDYDIILDIASTLQLAIPDVLIEDVDGDWRGVIEQLEDENLIPTGGDILFVEDEAFFAGQGAFFTPLASNSPRVNFVMAGTLVYTASAPYEDGLLETCTLSGRLLLGDDGLTSDFVEIGVDNANAFHYFTYRDNEVEYYGEFRRVEPNEPIHAMFIVNGETVTIFLDGEIVASNLPAHEVSGTFGISLVGTGPNASCVGENLWVYSLPQVETGVCRVITSAPVNKRVGPGTTFDIGGQLQANLSEIVIAQDTGTDGFVWWQLEDETWVRDDVVEVLGDCGAIPAFQTDA